MPLELKSQIEALAMPQIENLTEVLLDFPSIDDVGVRYLIRMLFLIACKSKYSKPALST
jgi:Domain of unknown function (DUF4351)